MSNPELKFIKVIYNEITLQVIPETLNLIAEDFVVYHEYNLDNPYTIFKIPDSNNYYKIQFANNINIYDSVKIYIQNENFRSNTIYVYLCKTLIDGSVILPFIHNNVKSGEYSLSVSQVSELPIDSTPLAFVICNGINLDISTVEASKNSYATNEAIDLSLNLFDNDFLPVPNADYNIKVKVEKQ